MRRLTGDPTAVWTILAGGSSAWQAARHPVAPGASHAPNVPSPSPCSLQLATCNLQLAVEDHSQSCAIDTFARIREALSGERAARGDCPARGA